MHFCLPFSLPILINLLGLVTGPGQVHAWPSSGFVLGFERNVCQRRMASGYRCHRVVVVGGSQHENDKST